MVQVGRGAPDAEVVEVRRGDYVIRGRVVWREGTRAGLQCDERLPVDEILSLSQASSLQLTAAAGFVERRKEPRLDYERSRLRARLFEFAGVAMLIGTFTVGILAMVEQALARPMAMIEAALGG